MRVLYIDPGNDSAVTAYATMLQGIMDKYIDSKIVGSLREMKAVFTEQVPQIVHVHGCWSAWTYRAVNYARRHGARVVITTHGQLEPWIMKERLWKEKLPKLVLFQRRMVSNAYAVVVMGQMEENSLRRLGWNPRLTIIRNPLMTSSVNENEIAHEMLQLYQKIQDSDVLKQLSDDDQLVLASLLKAYITGDRRWLSQEETERIDRMTDNKVWRRILLYAEHEHVRELVDRGLLVLNKQVPSINTKAIDSFFPNNYVLPQKILSQRRGTSNDMVLILLKGIARDIAHNRLPLLHLVELSAELRNPRLTEEPLLNTLRDKKVYTLLEHLMPLLEEQTGLSEGYMPVAPVDDRYTEKLRNILAKNLEI